VNRELNLLTARPRKKTTRKTRKIGKRRCFSIYGNGVTTASISISCKDKEKSGFKLSHNDITSTTIGISFENNNSTFLLIPDDRKITSEHTLLFKFYDANYQLVCSHSISNIFIAGHKYESGKKQKLFYENENK